MSLKAEKQIEGLGFFFVEIGDFNLKWIYGMTKGTNLISGNVSRHSQEPKSFTCFDLIKQIFKFLSGTFTSFFARFSLLHTNFFLLNCLAAYHNEVKPVLAAVLSALMKGPWSRRCFQCSAPRTPRIQCWLVVVTIGENCKQVTKNLPMRKQCYMTLLRKIHLCPLFYCYVFWCLFICWYSQ